jgi:hypothetical protein
VKYLVCGSRRFGDVAADLNASVEILKRIQELPSGATVIHGDALGADRFAAQAARKAGLLVHAYPADWNTHSSDCWCRGRGYCREAGKRRNLLMLDQNPDLVIAFWNGRSTGTLHTISTARERGLNLEVIRL